MFGSSRRHHKPTAYVISESELKDDERPSLTVQASSARQRLKERARLRILMCSVLFVFTFASLGVRLAFISFGEIDERSFLAAAPAPNAPRPEITDRNGAILATDLPMISLEIAGREIWDARETSDALAGALPELDADWLYARLREGRYVEAPLDLTPVERQAVFDLGLPGVRFATRVKRFYPQADLAGHVIGHGELGRGGVMGLERVANSWQGALGETMTASLDIRVQQILEDELSAAMEKFSAVAAWGAVMDVETGEVIALSSLPDFDPNDPGAVQADYRRNRATYDRYELGSAFKPFMAAAIIEEGLAEEATLYDARGSYKIADRRITDFHGENRILTLSEVIQYSSNIGIAQVASDLGTDKQKKYLKALGFFEPLDIELAENRDTQLPSQWGPVETATIAYGHGISVTPLHLLAGFTAIINGGQFVEPTFLKTSSGDKSAPVISPKTSAAIRRILRRVVTDGTASNADAAGYFPIGKTATADKPSKTGGYDRNTRIASFVGAFPGYAPRYAVIVSLDEPQPLKETYGYATAGWNAAPVFSRFVERAAPILGVVPVNEAVAINGFMSEAFGRRQEAALNVGVDASETLERTR